MEDKIQRIKLLNELVEHREQMINCKRKIKAGLVRAIDVIVFPRSNNPDDHIYVPGMLNTKIIELIIRMLESATAEIERELKTLNKDDGLHT